MGNRVDTHANAAFDTANLALSTAALAINYDNMSNAAFDQANVATTIAQSAYDYANTIVSDTQIDPVARTTGNSAFDKANSANVLAQSVYSYANTLGINVANSLIIVTTAPANNKGSGGDTKGMVYLANDYFYYCTTAYDGTTNIWSRIASTDAW